MERLRPFDDTGWRHHAPSGIEPESEPEEKLDNCLESMKLTEPYSNNKFFNFPPYLFYPYSSDN